MKHSCHELVLGGCIADPLGPRIAGPMGCKSLLQQTLRGCHFRLCVTAHCGACMAGTAGLQGWSSAAEGTSLPWEFWDTDETPWGKQLLNLNLS